MRTYRVTATKKFLELHSNLFVVTGRKASRAVPTTEMMRKANVERVKEIRKQSRFAK